MQSEMVYLPGVMNDNGNDGTVINVELGREEMG